jgi:hypothetical protein
MWRRSNARTHARACSAARSLGLLAGRFVAACAAGGANATLCLDDAAAGRDSTFNRKRHAEMIAAGVSACCRARG